MAVVINNSIFKNRFHGILTSLGHGIGIAVYAFFAVLGIALIIKTNLYIFNSIKFLSIIFLLYLGIKSIISKNKLDFDDGNLSGGVTSFLQGLSISLLNPKIFVWFIAIYSQFMSYDNDMFLNVALVLIAGTVDALWYILLVNLVTSKVILDQIKKKSDIIQIIVGYLLIIISAFLLLEVLI